VHVLPLDRRAYDHLIAVMLVRRFMFCAGHVIHDFDALMIFDSIPGVRACAGYLHVSITYRARRSRLHMKNGPLNSRNLARGRLR